MCVCVCVCVVFVQSCWLFNRAASFNEGPLELGCNKHALQVCLFICCITSFAFVYFCFPLFVFASAFAFAFVVFGCSIVQHRSTRGSNWDVTNMLCRYVCLFFALLLLLLFTFAFRFLFLLLFLLLLCLAVQSCSIVQRGDRIGM